MSVRFRFDLAMTFKVAAVCLLAVAVSNCSDTPVFYNFGDAIGGTNDAGATGDTTGDDATTTEDSGLADGGLDDVTAVDTAPSDTAPSDTAPSDAAPSDTSGDTSAASGACMGRTDYAIATAADLEPSAPGSQTATSIAQSCGIDCLGSSDASACSVDCIVAATEMSTPCAGCYGDVVICSIENCLGACGAGPNSAACAACQEDNCLGDFYACTGLPRSGASYCTNPADLPLVTSPDLDGGQAGAQTVTSIAQDCGIGCIGDADSRQCSIDCIVMDSDVSSPCAGCYGDVVICSIENCLGACGAGPNSAACAECQEDNCLGDFYTCTGLGG